MISRSKILRQPEKLTFYVIRPNSAELNFVIQEFRIVNRIDCSTFIEIETWWIFNQNDIHDIFLHCPKSCSLFIGCHLRQRRDVSTPGEMFSGFTSIFMVCIQIPPSSTLPFFYIKTSDLVKRVGKKYFCW